ncbi:MAG: acyl-CoA thioesterase II [Gammaproteobacteria bacterium]|nr:acyl-CoA thioesterase II [Gammaproteobacteria bacterium]
MFPIVEELLSHLALERLEDNLFRGPSRDIGTPQVYGGQVLGQALRAAQYTVEGRRIHSLHAYFLRRGDFNSPIIYEVDRSRDGGSFSARRVVAIQHGCPIFTLAASFQVEETGLEFQPSMPEVPAPGALSSVREYETRQLSQLPERFQRLMQFSAPFDLRPIDADAAGPVVDLRNCRRFWIKTVDRLPDDHDLHCAILAYVSDYGLLGTAVQPHGIHVLDGSLRMASIDHAMWFHRPYRIDEWLLCTYEAVSTSNGRGLARGSIFREDGTLIASTIQEGLMRVCKDEAVGSR